MQMMETAPEEFVKLVEEHPELQQMLEQDLMNMNGGQM
jgi:hypothetical protein